MRSAFIYPDDSRWRAALARTRHDVYHLPEYATLCGKHENGEPLAFYAEAGDSVCLIPLLSRLLKKAWRLPKTAALHTRSNVKSTTCGNEYVPFQVLQGLFQQPVRKRLPEELGSPLDWCDLVSPYGYPAPVYAHAGQERTHGFLGAFGSAADEVGACSVFLRLHPLFEEETGAPTALSACVRHGETVCVDLTHSEEELLYGGRLAKLTGQVSGTLSE